jgi:N utilization substance protein B
MGEEGTEGATCPPAERSAAPEGRPGGRTGGWAGRRGGALGGRRKARLLALYALYGSEVTGKSPEQMAAAYSGDPRRGPVPPYTLELLELVREHREEIDRIIESYSDRWPLQRMPMVDRSLLRMAVAEILYRDDVPNGVSASESVELAKRFSTADSGRFVNGILGHLIRDLEAGCGPAAGGEA